MTIAELRQRCLREIRFYRRQEEAAEAAKCDITKASAHSAMMAWSEMHSLLNIYFREDLDNVEEAQTHEVPDVGGG